jgi:hypothetical protein
LLILKANPPAASVSRTRSLNLRHAQKRGGASLDGICHGDSSVVVVEHAGIISRLDAKVAPIQRPIEALNPLAVR